MKIEDNTPSSCSSTEFVDLARPLRFAEDRFPRRSSQLDGIFSLRFLEDTDKSDLYRVEEVDNSRSPPLA
jgi:hypothetical protein